MFGLAQLLPNMAAPVIRRSLAGWNYLEVCLCLGFVPGLRMFHLSHNFFPFSAWCSFFVFVVQFYSVCLFYSYAFTFLSFFSLSTQTPPLCDSERQVEETFIRVHALQSMRIRTDYHSD